MDSVKRRHITAASYTDGLSVSLCKADHTARQKTHMTAVNKVQETQSENTSLTNIGN